MTTNAHILTLSKQIEEAKKLLQFMPQTSDMQRLVKVLNEMELQVFGVDVDYQNAIKRISELAAENYGSAIYEQEGAGHFFSYITPQCFSRHMADHVESHLRKACTESAKELWRMIHEYEQMGYLDTQHLSAAKLYRELNEHFGSLPYTERTFRDYR